MDVFEINPYESHPALSSTESELLWEYAKLAIHVKHVRVPAPIDPISPPHSSPTRQSVSASSQTTPSSSASVCSSGKCPSSSLSYATRPSLLRLLTPSSSRHPSGVSSTSRQPSIAPRPCNHYVDNVLHPQTRESPRDAAHRPGVPDHDFAIHPTRAHFAHSPIPAPLKRPYACDRVLVHGDKLRVCTDLPSCVPARVCIPECVECAAVQAPNTAAFPARSPAPRGRVVQ